MRRLLAVTMLVSLFPGTAVATSRMSGEGCRAFNPGQPRCTYKVTHTSGTPVTGVYGVGRWIVKVKRGGHTEIYESLPDGRPTVYEIAFKVGDKVTAVALSPGSMLEVGHDD